MYVDGELFPYLIDGTDGMQPLLKLGRASGVTFTILARHVTVDDQYLVGVDLSHAHEDQGDQSP